MNRLIRVLIVEDDELLLSGLEMIVDNEENMRVTGTAQNGLQALDIIKQSKPDIVLLDLEMPVMNGIECIMEIRKLYADLPVLILSSFSEDEYIYQGLAYGANGYLLKGSNFDSVVQTIRDVINHRFVLDADVGRRVAQFVFTRSDHIKKQSITRFFAQNNRFTQQEQEIIHLLLDRLPTKDIAEQLFFSAGTIKNKLTVIYEKMGVSSREEAIRYLETETLK